MAVLCLRSDLVVVQDVAVSAQGGSCSSVAAAPLHSVYVAWDSLLKLAVVVALVGESLLSMNGGKCTIHLCYLWQSKVFNRTFELGLLLLGIWIALPVVELLQRNKI